MTRLDWKRGPAYLAHVPSGVMYEAEYQGKRLEIHKGEFQNMYRGGPRFRRYWLTVDGVQRGSREVNLYAVRGQAQSMVSWAELGRELRGGEA